MDWITHWMWKELLVLLMADFKGEIFKGFDLREELGFFLNLFPVFLIPRFYCETLIY